MSRRYERRSKEAPMDFEWTNKDRNVIFSDSPFKPAKRSHTDMATPNPPFPQHNPATPTFGTNRDVPFIFNQPMPVVTPTHPWTPPPKTTAQGLETEIKDVTMQDASPTNPEETNRSSSVRAVATGAMRRVFRARQRHSARGSTSRRRQIDPDGDPYSETDEEEPSENDQLGEMISQTKRRELRKSYSEPVTTTANHNHHYTLHMPAPHLSHSEVPYLLLGYLQFFFNLSLVLGFFYLAYQFFRAVQKDVEQKMTEHAIESLHEIRACARQFENNFCAGRPSPIIEQQCLEWKECMERDASIVGRTRLLAELVGEVINGFMEPITWRTLVFVLSSLSMGIAFVNALLMFYRGRHAPTIVQSTPHHQPNPSFPMYGASPSPQYWKQVSSSAPPFFHPSTPEIDMRRTWSSPAIETDDLGGTHSRRRKTNENDVVRIR